MLAAMVAKNINAPDSVILFETGAMDSLLEELSFAVTNPRIMYWTAANPRLTDVFATMQNKITGDKVLAILSAAQIDIGCFNGNQSVSIHKNGTGNPETGV